MVAAVLGAADPLLPREFEGPREQSGDREGRVQADGAVALDEPHPPLRLRRKAREVRQWAR